MGNIKKITIAVGLENEKYLQILMSKIKFLENSRVATGGMMSSPMLLIEFQGDEDTYHEKGYIVKKSKNEWISDTYYTISNPDGKGFKNLDEFLNNQKEKEGFYYNEVV
jgi:hypothetical protein